MGTASVPENNTSGPDPGPCAASNLAGFVGRCRTPGRPLAGGVHPGVSRMPRYSARLRKTKEKDGGMDANRQPLRVLLVEDNALDAELILHHLGDAGFDPAWHRVESEADYLAALEPALDLIVSDFHMPRFGALRALDLLNEADIDVPLVVVSGSIGEETAVQLLKKGASGS